MSCPLVTVTICTYNGEQFLPETLNSVLAQTYANTEVVIVDDGSRDGTVSIIKEYAERDSRIRWFSRENAGLPASRNFAFTQARGEWIAIIDQDDLCYPERLQRQIAIAEAYPSAGLIFCNTDYIDSKGVLIGSHFSKFILPDSFIPKGIAANLLLRQGCYVDSEACFIKRTTVNHLGPLDELLRYACDYEYFIRAGFDVDFAYTTETLAAWRIHTEQLSAKDLNRFKEIRDVLAQYFWHTRLTIYTQMVISLKIVRLLAAEAYHVIRNRCDSFLLSQS